MARLKGSKSKSISKKGTSSGVGFHGGIQDPFSGANAFTVGFDKTASLSKNASGEYSTTQVQSFFYSPELNIMGS